VKILANGTTYDFRIRATNLSGDSAPTNVASARPMPPKPQPPSGLSTSVWLSSNAMQNYLRFSWAASSTPDVTYRVYYQNPVDASRGVWREVWRNLPTLRFEIFERLYGGDVYRFRVSAWNISGETFAAASISETAKPAKPQAYHRLTAGNGLSYSRFWTARADRSTTYWQEYGFDWQDNGCSNPIDGIYGRYDNDFFRSACVRHDYGYRNHGSWGAKGAIDYTFFWDMLNLCAAEPSSDARERCREFAEEYYNGVRLFGWTAW
jgi:hypothetical protein